VKRTETADIWVFGYGSLMWNPGFPHLEVRPARLHGYHRAFCLYSYHYRGSEAQPGLVLGLDRGGSCLGRAFRVAGGDAEAAMAYLVEREMFGHEEDVYRLVWPRIGVEGRRVPAACFVINGAHPHYAGKLPPQRIAALIRRGVGSAGSNADYLRNTIQHLDALGIKDGALHLIEELVSHP
jgi:cation transport protein ChaC